jgi:hypothetical protein
VNATSTDHEQLYARERRVLEDRRVLPLVVQAESVGLGANVRDWMPARWGEWHLADVWLDLPVPGEAAGSDANPERLPVIHMPAKPMGAKP